MSDTNPEPLSQTVQPFGVYVQPGIGNAYPELKKQELALIVKAGTIPWLPQGWLDAVRDLDKSNPSALIKFAPSGTFKANGTPAFLNSPERVKVWDDLAASSSRAQMLYAQDQAAAGKAELEALYAKAAFWDSAYNIAVAIRDAPKTVLTAGADLISDNITNLAKKLLLPALIVGTVALIWYNKEAIAKMVGGKIAKV